jgi:hypothetical protein
MHKSLIFIVWNALNMNLHNQKNKFSKNVPSILVKTPFFLIIGLQHLHYNLNKNRLNIVASEIKYKKNNLIKSNRHFRIKKIKNSK